jgi:hypothetical protein
MFQPDLFTKDMVAEGPDFPAEVATLRVRENGVPAPRSVPKTGDTDLDLPSLLERLAAVSSRPRYTYMVLNLIAQAAGQSNSAGPYVRENGRVTPVRDWLSDALLPMAQRDFRRRAVVEQVRCDLESKNLLPPDREAADRIVADEVRERLLHSGRTNVSRAVSDLVRAGLVHRHYQGYRVDHPNRGAQREAVYTIAPAVQRALGKAR